MTMETASLAATVMPWRPARHGQVLVLHDMLGITPGKAPSFSRNFMARESSIEGAMRAFVEAVHNGEFPAGEHCFQ